MTTAPMHVLQQTYTCLRDLGDSREVFIGSLFSSYLGDRGSKSTAHRYMTYPNVIPRSLIRHYADPSSPFCPSALYTDILFLLKEIYPLTTRHRMQLWDVLLNIRYTLPAEDQYIISVDTAVQLPSSEKVARLFTQILWCAICQEHAQASLNNIA